MRSAIDLTKLIEGLVVVILIALAVGKFDALRAFAVKEAAQSLRGWDTHAFFQGEYQKLLAAPRQGQVHLKGVAAASSAPRSDQPKHR